MDKRNYHPGWRIQMDSATHPKDPIRERVSLRQIVTEELAATKEKLEHALRMLRMQDVKYALLEDDYSTLNKDYWTLKADHAALTEMHDELLNSYNILLDIVLTMRPKLSFNTIVYHQTPEAEHLTQTLTRYRDEVKLLEARIDEQEQENANLRFALSDADAWHKGPLREMLHDSIVQLMEETDVTGIPIMKFRRQWWAIYRVLVDDYGAPDGYSDFCLLMDSMGLGEGSSIAHPCSMESLKKIERPFTLPIRDWEPLAKGIKPHQRQYRVAVALRRIIKKRCTA